MNKESNNEPWFSTQQQLMEDDKGVKRDALLQNLADNIRGVKRQMDAGVTPAEFARLDKIRQGLEAATEVVATAWRLYHPA